MKSKQLRTIIIASLLAVIIVFTAALVYHISRRKSSESFEFDTVETHESDRKKKNEEKNSFSYYENNEGIIRNAFTTVEQTPLRLQDTAEYAEAYEKASALLARMTLDEKIDQLSQSGESIYGDDKEPDRGCVGSYLNINGAEETNGIQDVYLQSTRLKIPALFAADVIHGYRTVFPTPLAQSCSWNPECSRLSCEVSAKEAYGAGIRWTFSPMVDIARDPRWGRIMEGYGEDAFLCSRFAEAAVKGYQGDDAVPGENQIFACMKHYVAYGAAIGGRDYNAADMSVQTLFDVYTPPFEAGINAGAATVMPAFESFNGVPVTASVYLLKDLLRDRFGFGGVTVSDYNSVRELVQHGVAQDDNEAAEKSFNAGTDISMACDLYKTELPKLVGDGRVDIADIDEAVTCVLALKYLCGLMDDPFTDECLASCLGCDDHRASARRVAAECAVLLENDGTLPLENVRSVALTGPYASGDGAANLMGNWSCMGRDDETITNENGFRNVFPDTKIDVINGCTFDGKDDDHDAAVRRAAGYDVIIACVGEEKRASGEAASVSDLSLPGAQEDFVLRLCETGKPVVVVVCAGRPLIMTRIREKASALLYAWQLGTESGNVIADMIAGNVNPSGRLTVSFPVSTGQLPVYYNHTPTGRPATEKNRYTSKYVDCSIEPLYPFGFGKSYTKFEYSDIRLSDTKMIKDGSITVSLTVTNTGDRDGATVVQLYVRDVVASRTGPVKELKGFQKAFLKSGESREVTVALTAESLAFADEEANRIVEPGLFRLWVAENSADERYEFEFSVID